MPLGRSGGIRKISLSPGFELRTVQKPVARNYTGRHIRYVVWWNFVQGYAVPIMYVDEVGKEVEDFDGI
jgi:hypothetical protein